MELREEARVGKETRRDARQDKITVAASFTSPGLLKR